jgi:hypothetical protein
MTPNNKEDPTKLLELADIESDRAWMKWLRKEQRRKTTT